MAQNKDAPNSRESADNRPRFAATPEILVYLDDLVATGLFGTRRSEVAGRLISMSIRQLIREEYWTPNAHPLRGPRTDISLFAEPESR